MSIVSYNDSFQPPLGRIELNLFSPLTRGLQRAYLFGHSSGNLVESIYKEYYTITGTPTIVPTEQGTVTYDLEYGANPSSNKYITCNDDYKAAITNKITVLMWHACYRPSVGGTSTRAIIANGQVSSTGYNWILSQPSQSGGVATGYISFLKTTGGIAIAGVTGILPNYGDTATVLAVMRYDGSAGHFQTYAKTLEGVGGWGPPDTSKSGNVTSTDFDTQIGHWGTTSVNNQASIRPHTISIHNEVLTDEEIEFAYRNPWTLYKPKNDVFYIDTGTLPSTGWVGGLPLMGVGI